MQVEGLQNVGSEQRKQFFHFLQVLDLPDWVLESRGFKEFWEEGRTLLTLDPCFTGAQQAVCAGVPFSMTVVQGSTGGPLPRGRGVGWWCRELRGMQNMHVGT